MSLAFYFVSIGATAPIPTKHPALRLRAGRRTRYASVCSFVALTFGEALRQALNDKRGIQRYGFLLPMDESLTQIALDLSGRPYLKFEAQFNREKVGDLPTELVSHFFYSLTQSLKATLHIQVKGENTHHMIEAIFKGVGRTLQQAIARQGYLLPTTKGVL